MIKNIFKSITIQVLYNYRSRQEDLWANLVIKINKVCSSNPGRISEGEFPSNRRNFNQESLIERFPTFSTYLFNEDEDGEEKTFNLPFG